MTKKIPLGGKYGKGKFALVDDEDYEYLSQFRWSICNGYAMRKEERQTVYMHRQVISTPKGMHTDHINGNRLDNRKNNLRVCTHQQNTRYQKPRIGGSSKYKGVSFYKAGGSWEAKIAIDCKNIYLGRYNTEKEAAEAYNQAALELHGNFAKLNEV